ncbi:MAG: protease complex subunit PrcB family protein, partial [Candidatus Tectomicrobia bacterium]|nr:protease complex subunit PrcB family protein [Candidatus Tectomicrobia bacterium]
TILSVQEREGVLYVRYRERRPQPGEFVTQAFTTPYHVRVVPRRDAQAVVFEHVYPPTEQ